MSWSCVQRRWSKKGPITSNGVCGVGKRLIHFTGWSRSGALALQPARRRRKLCTCCVNLNPLKLFHTCLGHSLKVFGSRYLTCEQRSVTHYPDDGRHQGPDRNGYCCSHVVIVKLFKHWKQNHDEEKNRFHNASKNSANRILFRTVDGHSEKLVHPWWNWNGWSIVIGWMSQHSSWPYWIMERILVRFWKILWLLKAQGLDLLCRIHDSRTRDLLWTNLIDICRRELDDLECILTDAYFVWLTRMTRRFAPLKTFMTEVFCLDLD